MHVDEWEDAETTWVIAGHVEEADLDPSEAAGVVEQTDGEAALLAPDAVVSTDPESYQPTAPSNVKVSA